MVKPPNFREFYQRAPIVIGDKDRLAISAVAALSNPPDNFTHWLIAIEGEDYQNFIDLNENSIRWKVVIFPLRLNGEFDYLLPYFSSTFFNSIQEAIEYTRQLELLAREDQLNSINPPKKLEI